MGKGDTAAALAHEEIGLSRYNQSTATWTELGGTISAPTATFTASVSANGTAWTTVGSPLSIAMGSSVKVGLAVVSKNTSTLNAATFTNVTVVP